MTKEGALDSKTASAHLSLLNGNVKMIHGLICKKIMSLGCIELYKNKPKLMQEIGEVNLNFARFISKTATRLSAGKLIGYKRSEPVTYPQVKGLIHYTLEDKLINEEDAQLYLNLIEWEEMNWAFVEVDILSMVNGMSYSEISKKTPGALNHIKLYYEEWFTALLKPHQEQIKNNLTKK